ncbi:Tautomerase [Niveomyces insectorum RCEF 264]|uniref:L-dopachrome isomerase n=1 Tax=Niveomyces insectorum RCEF 264 TaxID=1081102 RepID=A0A167T4F1_9HYPO|nr:Tautomerase [Niveomyces insectorum RCEF 264]
MPFIELTTNIELSAEKKKQLVLDLTQAAADILNKPYALFNVCVRSGETFAYGGSFEPCFQLQVTALNIFNPQDNIKFAAGFSKFLEDRLQLSTSRGYINFYNPTDPNTGFKGTTMAEVRKMT